MLMQLPLITHRCQWTVSFLTKLRETSVYPDVCLLSLVLILTSKSAGNHRSIGTAEREWANHVIFIVGNLIYLFMRRSISKKQSCQIS